MNNRTIVKVTGVILLIATFISIFIFADLLQKDIRPYPESKTGITLCINEVMYDNLGTYTDSDGDASDWIEIYNYGDESIDLNGYSLADGVSSGNKWYFPDITIDSGEYLIVFASGKNRTDKQELHTDFRISENDRIGIYDEQNRQIDMLYFKGQVDCGISVGRLIKQPESFALLSAETPGKPNNAKAISSIALIDTNLGAPEFSADSGIYNSEFELELFCTSGDEIVYTLDGTEPGIDSQRYSQPILIDEKRTFSCDYSNMRTDLGYSFEYEWENTYDYHGVTVRARIIRDGVLSDEIVSNTYFVNPPVSLPIVAIEVDPVDMFDEMDGIYVPGITYSLWKKYNKEDYATVYPPANYSGNKKVDATVHIFDENQELITENKVLLSLFGSGSRKKASKSMKLTINEAGASFDDSIYTLLPSSSQYESGQEQIVIRNSGIDFNKLMFRDVLAQSIIANKTSNTYLAAEPVVAFINGEYWGVFNIREVYDANYFYRHFGISEKSLVCIDLHVSVEPDEIDIKSGTKEDLNDYYELINFVQSNDMSIDDNYQYVCSQIDIDNYMDYLIAELYFGNNDWPGNNFRIWRAKQSDSDYGDGKWRFLLFDIDEGFSHVDYDSISALFDENEADPSSLGVSYISRGNSELARALIKNSDFREAFFDRFELYLDTIFSSDVVSNKIEELYKIYEPEMESHFKRWHTKDGWLNEISNSILNKESYFNNLYSYEKWKDEIELAYTFANKRPEFVRKCIEEYLNEFKN